MNKKERVALVRAMDLIARSCDDENAVMHWSVMGVADGDIDENTTDDELTWYAHDEILQDLMRTFLSTMKFAKMYGGLYCDGVTSVKKKGDE